MITQFLGDFDRHNHDVKRWSRGMGIRIDWERENRLFQEFQRKREVGKGKGDAPSHGSGSTESWTRNPRPRR
mgnify:CR=1 FL=1